MAETAWGPFQHRQTPKYKEITLPQTRQTEAPLNAEVRDPGKEKPEPQRSAAMETPPNPALLPSKCGEGHSTAHGEMGDVQLIREEAKGASGAILSYQPKSSIAGESAMPLQSIYPLQAKSWTGSCHLAVANLH